MVRFRIIRFRMNIRNTAVMVPAIERATHAIGLWIEHALADLRLTQAEAHVLAYLASHAPCAINDLHRSFGHKRSTLTSILDRLEERGWVARGAHPQSRRLVLVELTETGREVAQRVSNALQALEGRVLARAGDAEVAAFLRVLRVLEEEAR
jgi:DNA-binding MarR family transcriptional regulator